MSARGGRRGGGPEAAGRRGGGIGRRAALLLLFSLALGVPLPAAAAKTKGKTKPKTQPKTPPKPKGVTHLVRAGENLFRIGQAYQVKVALLLEANRLKPSAPLTVGQRLFIPGAAAVKTVEPYRPLSGEERARLEESLRPEREFPPEPPAPPPAPAPPPRPRVRTDALFAWPIVGPLNSPFGPRQGRLHAGIDIGSPHYQEVTAAADAEVLYAKDTGAAFGKAVVLQHGNGYRTVYAHLSILIAREGDAVRQGQVIGGVGDTGRATGPHLHFEIRDRGVPVNPAELLPATIDELVRDLAGQPARRSAPGR